MREEEEEQEQEQEQEQEDKHILPPPPNPKRGDDEKGSSCILHALRPDTPGSSEVSAPSAGGASAERGGRNCVLLDVDVCF